MVGSIPTRGAIVKLETAIRMGFACGLNTVDECINFADLHYWHVVPTTVWHKERSELYKEEELYYEGKLKLDLEKIKQEVIEEENKFFENQKKTNIS